MTEEETKQIWARLNAQANAAKAIKAELDAALEAECERNPYLRRLRDNPPPEELQRRQRMRAELDEALADARRRAHEEVYSPKTSASSSVRRRRARVMV